MKRYPNWDLLRLAAALTVVYLHFQAFTWGKPLRYPILMDPVPTFVCLSGLLIPQSFDGSRSWGHFAWKRALRVYPAFFASLLLVAGLFGPSVFWPTIVTYLTMGFVHLTGAANGVLWSLILEEVLYTQLAVAKLRRCWNPYSVGVAFAACIVGWFFFRFTHGNEILRASAAFFAGNLAYFALPKLEKISGWLLLGIYAAAYVPVCLVPYFQTMTVTSGPMTAGSTLQIAWAVFGSLLLVLGFRNIKQVSFKFPDLSYGVYVYHAPILIAVLRYTRHTPWLTISLAALGSLALALLSWYLVEKPSLRWKDARFRLPRKTRPSSSEVRSQSSEALPSQA